MPPMSQKTRSSTPRLSEQAKHLSVPEGIVASGWPAIRKTCIEKLGAEFDPWQDNAGRLILSKRQDGNLAATVDGVGMSLPRQVGKTHLVGFMVFALCVNNPGLLVIWTAHHSATTSETFLSMQSFAERAKIAPHVRKVYTGSGDEEVRFHNGSRILFGAREHGFGRGIAGVDVLIFDEAQILSDKAMSNMLATMNTSRFGLHLYIGTPPKPEDEGRSEAFKRMRREALAGTLPDGAWIEFGADSEADSNDRKQWRKMNPSHPKRTPAQSLLRLQRKLTDGDWRREGMGIWDDDTAGSRLVPADVWDATGVTKAPDGVRSIGVAFSRDGERVSTAGAAKHDDGIHAELIAAYSGPAESGTWQLADWLAERWRDLSMIALSGAASAALHQALVDRGVSRRVIHTVTTSEYFAANTMTLDALQSRTLTHPVEVPGDALSASVAVSDMKKRGQNGQWGWEATTPDGDETPVEAFSVAYWAARTSKRMPGRKQVLI